MFIYNIYFSSILFLFFLFFVNLIISSPTPVALLPESHHNHHLPSLPTINLFEEESQQKIIWKAIERTTLENTPDAILLKEEFCKKPCNEIIGRGAEKIQKVECVCHCPITEPIFVNNKEEGKCSMKINDCFGHPLRFELNSTKYLQKQKHYYAPTFSLSKNGEPLDFNLNIAWKENGIKMRSRGGPKCLIKNIFILGNNSEWKEINKQLFKLAEWNEEKNFNGNLLWTGNDQEIQEISGGIVRLELECATKNNGGGNSSFCLSFRIEGQIESKEIEKTEKIIIGNGNVGMEVEKGRRVEVVVIILLGIFLFLSLFGSILLWNVCWRVQKRKLVHSLQMQFFHYARQEKEKAVSECQLRYQALVKAAAGMRSDTTNSLQSPSFSLNRSENNLNMEESPNRIPLDDCFSSPSSSCEYGGNDDIEGGGNNLKVIEEQQQNGARRKLYFSSEFFEPKLMSTPPPIAEQFLYDLRKMISVARERIRNRRHVPRLPPVAESDDETTVSITTANGNCIITGSLPTKSEQIQIKEDKNITPNICLNNKENSRKEEKEELKNAGNLQQKRDYLGENKEEKGEEIINEEKKEIIEEEKIKEEKELKPFFEEEEICSETKIDLFNENFELNEIMENKEVDLVKEEKEIIKKENEGGELNENNEILDNEEIEEFKKEIVLENGKEEKEEVKKDEEMPIEEWLIEDKQSTKTPSETSEEEKTKPEHIENKKEVLSIPQNISEHLNNNIPPSRIPSAIPSTINGKSPRIPLKFSSSALNRKTTTNNLNNYVKPPPLPPRPPPQINGQNNGNGTPVMKESFLTVMAAKRKAATGIARRQKQCGREEEDKSLSIDSPSSKEENSPAPRNGRRLFYATCLQPPSYYMGDSDSTTMKKSLPRRKKVAAVNNNNNSNQTSTPTGIPTPTTTTLVK